MDLANCKKALELILGPFSSLTGIQAAPVSNTSAAATNPAGGLLTDTHTSGLYVAHQTASTDAHTDSDTQAETEEQFPETKISDMTEPDSTVGFDFRDQVFMRIRAA